VFDRRCFHLFIFSIENLLHHLFGALAQTLTVAVEHLERLVPALGDAGDEKFQVLVEADVPFQRLVVGEFGRGAFEDLRDLIVDFGHLLLKMDEMLDIGGPLGEVFGERLGEKRSRNKLVCAR
jgi:hypothetical protein